MNKRLRIVVADDEPVVRDYFLKILPLLGYEVVAAAANGCELVELCRQQRPDLVIADVRMPAMDGDVAIHQICSEHPVPFILVSAYSKPVNIPDALDSVNWAYLTKPIKREDLEAAIQRVLEQNRERCGN